MNFISKIGFTGLLVGLLMLGATSKASANEGRFVLQNTVGGSSRCEVTSGLFSDGEYNLMFICRDLVYPISSDLFLYVAWTVPADGSDPIKLGSIGVGKILFKTKKPFNTILVTQEKSNTNNLKSPTGPIAMRGNFQLIEFLDDPSQVQAPTQPGQTPIPTAVASPAPNRTVSNILKGGGIITAVAVFLIILMLILVKPFK